MDYEDVANVSNLPVDADITPEMSSGQIAHEILFFVFCLLGMVADSLIIYTIFKFQRLRTVSNILIANWAIADIFSLIVTPSGLRIFSAIEQISILKEVFCIFMNASMELHASIMMFAILVCLNWSLESYFKKWLAIVKKYYQIGVGLVWFITLVSITMCIKECFTSRTIHLYHPHITLLVVLIIYVSVVVILQITRGITKCCRKPTENSGLMLNLATVFLACWFLALMTLSGVSTMLNHAFQLIVECLLFSSSILNLAILYFYSQDFQAHFRQVISCLRNKYQESSVSFENPIVRVQNGKLTVEVSFNNQNNTFLNC